jgi:hypothetical protein
MVFVGTRAVSLTVETFLADSHARRYRDVVISFPHAFARVLAILNDPRHQQELTAAERYGRPALSGVVGAIEADPCIAEVLASPSSPRFRQTVGVAVRLTMEALGWSTARRKGPVHATYFKRAERYQPPPDGSRSLVLREAAKSALNAVGQIGDEDERAQTGADLLSSLAATRQAEGRSF